MADSDIKSLFIVDGSDYTKDKVQKFAEKAIKHGKLSKTGDILFENHNLLPEAKLKLALALRFIGHSFDNSIPESVTFDEFQKILPGESKEAVGARSSNLVSTGYAMREGRGVYVAYPHRIEPFLSELDNPERKSITRGKRKSSAARKPGTLSGIGKDIQALIDQKFFETPKTVIEVKKQLETDVKFHDVRVIDSTVRRTFVVNRKILKRIPAEGAGKARWKYVVRT